MTAVAEATRGPIREVTRIRYGMSQEAAQAECMAAMDRVMEELEPVLKQPVYEGDVETALIHNMGRAAFGFGGRGSDDVRAYIRFSEAIDANTDEGPTPVLLVSQIKSGGGTRTNTETALVMVDPEETTFRSGVMHERDVQERGYSGKIAITRQTLSLVGDTSTIHADISGYGHDLNEISPYAQKVTGHTELVLDERSVIDGKNGRKPVEIDHNNIGAYTQDIDRMWAGPKYLVGWEAIGRALTARIDDNAQERHGRIRQEQDSQGVFTYALKLREFLEYTGQLEVLVKRNAPLKKVLEAAVSLEESVAALAPDSDHYED